MLEYYQKKLNVSLFLQLVFVMTSPFKNYKYQKLITVKEVTDEGLQPKLSRIGFVLK
jgi:hypothetical protein